jgi:NADPH-dependent 2,4-dienoyl-CoA reductase/sulfur reductase-like enzyme
MKDLRIAIVGAGAAGMSALQTVRELDKKVNVTVVSDSDPYSPFAFAEFIAGRIDKRKLKRFDREYFDEMGAKFINERVEKVDTKNHNLLLNNGRRVKYDRLLLAHGSVPMRPPIPGMDKEGVFYLSSLVEAERGKEQILGRKAGNVAIIGAGFTGLEAATSLNRIGISVTIVEVLDSVLPAMLDPDVAGKVATILRSEGVKIHLGERVVEILGGERVEKVRTDKRAFKTDAVMSSIGARPNLAILKGSRIKKNTGIIVNENMRTNIRDVFAAGDVIEFKDALLGLRTINGIWPNAVYQGRVAAYNMLGTQRTYEGSDIVNIINIFGTPVVAIGYTRCELKDFDEVVLKAGGYMKLHIQNDIIVGFQGIGNRAMRFAGLIHGLMKRKADIKGIRPDLEKGRLNNLFAELHDPERSTA